MEQITLSQMCHFRMTREKCIITLPPPPIVYEAVDLGLPSGTKWATQNVGARKPSDYGLYFQWGDTVGYTADQVGTGEGQKKFAKDWSDYKWRLSGDSYDNVAFTKYTTTGATLDLEDDAAHANMEGDWHMPSPTQIQELLDNTTKTWTTQDEVSGVTFTSKNDKSKSIFIPGAGRACDGSVQDSGMFGYVWSSMLSVEYVTCAQWVSSASDPYLNRYNNGGRYLGYSVRGVIG